MYSNCIVIPQGTAIAVERNILWLIHLAFDCYGI